MYVLHVPSEQDHIKNFSYAYNFKSKWIFINCGSLRVKHQFFFHWWMNHLSTTRVPVVMMMTDWRINITSFVHASFHWCFLSAVYEFIERQCFQQRRSAYFELCCCHSIFLRVFFSQDGGHKVGHYSLKSMNKLLQAFTSQLWQLGVGF